MRDTPRTNDAVDIYFNEDGLSASASLIPLCRELERELAEERQISASLNGNVTELGQQIEALRENLEILHDAMILPPGSLTHTQGQGYAESRRASIVRALLHGPDDEKALCKCTPGTGCNDPDRQNGIACRVRLGRMKP